MDKQTTAPTTDAAPSKGAKLKLNYPQTFKVGLAFAGITLFWGAYDFVIPLLLENAYGLSNTIRGLIMGLDNLLSLFLLPIMGRLSDKSHGRLSKRFGRRTPFIIFGTIAAVVCMVFVPLTAKTQMDNSAVTRASYEAQLNDDTFMSERLTEFYDAAVADGNANYCDLNYLKLSLKERGMATDDASLKTFFTSIRYDSNLSSKSGFLGIGGTTYKYGDTVIKTDDDGKLIGQTENGVSYQSIKEGNENYNTFAKAGMTTWISSQIEEETFHSKSGITSIVFYMILLLMTLICMSTYRSPAVALMPDVTPKPLRSQANAIINLCGGVGGGLALITYTIILMFPVTSTSYILIFAICAALMLLLLACFLWLVKEPKLVEKCNQECIDFGISDEDEEAEEKKEELLFEEKEEKLESEAAANPAVKVKKDPDKNSFKYKVFKFYYDKNIPERAKFRSFILILASIFMWFIGYNAVSSSLSIYCTKALLLSPGTASIISAISMAISAIAFIPVGFLAVKIGRKKSIMLGFALAVVSYLLLLLVLNPGDKEFVKAALFATFYLISGFGLIIANVNTFPMVVELAKAQDVGKYTGYYYTATMSAQAITPFIAGLVMDNWGMKYLFAYSAVAVAIAIACMCFVKHGDSKQLGSLKKLSKDEKKQVMLDSMGDAD